MSSEKSWGCSQKLTEMENMPNYWQKRTGQVRNRRRAILSHAAGRFAV